MLPLKAKLTVPQDVRALLSMSVPICGEIKLRSFAAELLLVHYGEENMSAICYISCDCHMTSFPIDWSIEKVLEVWKKDPFETLKDAKLRMPVQIWLTKIYLTQLKSFGRLETPTNILQSSNKSLQ